MVCLVSQGFYLNCAQILRLSLLSMVLLPDGRPLVENIFLSVSEPLVQASGLEQRPAHEQCNVCLLQKQCVGSGFVFYGSGSWIFFPDPGAGSRQQQKNKIFQSQNKILGEILVSNPKSRYFIFVFNQSSTGKCFIKQGTFNWYHF